jgi:hypothetical protein
MNFVTNFFKPSESARIAKFWEWFTATSDTVFGFEKDQETIFNELKDELKKVQPHLTFEIGPDEEGVREFVFSADGFKDAIPTVENIVKAAPTLPRWKFVAFRQPIETLLTMYYGNVILPPEDIWVLSEKKGGKVDIHFFIAGYLPTKKNDYLACVLQLLDHLIGEYIVMTKVGAIDIDIAPKDPPAAGLKPFGDLKAKF